MLPFAPIMFRDTITVYPPSGPSGEVHDDPISDENGTPVVFPASVQANQDKAIRAEGHHIPEGSHGFAVFTATNPNISAPDFHIRYTRRGDTLTLTTLGRSVPMLASWRTWAIDVS